MSDLGSEPGSRPERRRDAGSLLDEIAERSLDDDYYYPIRPGRYPRSREVRSFATALMVAVFALMVTVTAVQTQRDRPATALERKALETDVTAGRAKLSAKQKLADRLRAEDDLLESAVDAGSPANLRLHVMTGDTSVRGPGIVVRLDPQQNDIDDTSIQGILNAIWAAGAEAVALNGQRIAALTSVGEGGGVITVNFRSVGAPFEFSAIGNPQVLRQRFESATAAQYWAAKSNDDDAEFSVRTSDALTLPAAPDSRTSVRVARVVKEP